MSTGKQSDGIKKFHEFRDELSRASTGLLTLLAHGLGNLHGHPDQDALLGALRAEIVAALEARKTQTAKPAAKEPTAEPTLDTALEQALGKVLGGATGDAAA